MAAPAIVLVASSDHDPAACSALEAIAARLCAQRPDLSVRLGILGDETHQVVDEVRALVDAGATEVALVPLDLVSAAEHSPIVCEAKRMMKDAESVHVVISRPVGPAVELLNILDNKVRESLHRTNAVEVDALVLATPEGGDVRGASLLARRARQWSAHHKLPVLLASNDETGRGTGNAIATLRGQGRRHIAVGSLFLTPSPRYRAHHQMALRAGALAVTDPIADDPRLVELILARYAFAAMDLLDVGPPEQQQEAN